MVDFVESYGMGSVISFTPNLYTYVTIHNNNLNKYIINYTKREETKNISEIQNHIVKECFLHFKTPPCTLTFNTDILSTGSGLASSSSFIISTIKALCLFQNIKMTNKQICDLSFKIERKINSLAGYQDVYGSGVGSFKRIDFFSTNKQTYKFLDFSFITNKYSMALINTGITRKSTNILKTINIEKSKKILNFVDQVEQCIFEKNEELFFTLFNAGWQAKKQTSTQIMANLDLIQLEKKIIQSNMVKGIKLCGAGGGGYFFVFLKKENFENFKKYMNNNSSKNIITKVNIETNGVIGNKI